MKRTRMLTFVAVAAGILLGSFALEGHAQGKGGGGGGGGTAQAIYFAYDSSVWKMNSDGSGKTRMPLSSLGWPQPSKQLHGGHRWFLQLRTIPGEYYPMYSFVEHLNGSLDDFSVVENPAHLGQVEGASLYVKIDSVGPTDTFQYGWLDDQPLGAGIPITGGDQDLDLFGDGTAILTIRFDNVTGHALNDRWGIRLSRPLRRELFAVREDGNEGYTTQLTNDPALEKPGVFGTGEHRWVSLNGVSDSAISFRAFKWVDNMPVAAGVYRLQASFHSPSGRFVATTSEQLVAECAVGDSWRPFVTILRYDWNPNGSRIVFTDDSRRIVIRDLATQAESVFTLNNGSLQGGPAWSHDGNLIAFTVRVLEGSKDYSRLETMRTDWTNRKVVVSYTNKTSGATDTYTLRNARWSPDNSSLGYVLSRWGFLSQDTDTYRVRADGRQNTNLTSDLPAGTSGSRFAPLLDWR